jgi:hypothetical protein
MKLRRDKPEVQFEVDIPPEMTQGMTGFGQLAPRISRREALQVPAVLRGRNLIAGSLARLPIHIRDQEHNIATPTTLLDQIDPDIPNIVTLSETYEDLIFESVSWWRITQWGWHGFPTFAEHVSPNRVHVAGWTLPVDGLQPSIMVGPMKVYIDGHPVPDEEIIRFDSPNPPLLVHGARAIRTCLTLDLTATRYASESLPLGYFTPKDGTRPNEDDTFVTGLLDRWETARARRVWAYVGSMWEAKTLQFDAQQIQLADAREHAVLEIARAMGIDPEALGLSTTSRIYKNAEQERLDLLDFTMAPYVSAIEQRLSMRDVLPRGYEAKVNLDGFLRSDTMTRMNAYKVGLDVGAYTPEEVRDLEDRPPLTPAQKAAAAPAPAPPIPAPPGASTGTTEAPATTGTTGSA